MHPYIMNVRSLSDGVIARFTSVLLQSDFIFYYLSHMGREFAKSVKQVKEFSSFTINERRKTVSTSVKNGSRL